MNNIVLDFRQNYVRGERLESQEIAYQYDEGRILEAYVPETETDFFVHVGFENDPKLSVITVDSVEAAETGGGYKILADIPSSIMTRYGTMLVYIIAADANDMIVTTYEGEVPIRHKGVAEDYVVPDEEATSIIERADAARAAAVVAQTAAETAAQSAEASAEQAMSGTPEGYANLVGSMAPAYSTASTYAVGDHVLHDSKLYVCNTAITTAEAWTAAHWTAVTAGGELSQLKSHKADINGRYPDMGAGYANQLVSGLKKEDSTPYNFRAVPYNATLEEVEKIVGGTIAWNQLAQNGNFADGTTGWQVTKGVKSASGGILTSTVNQSAEVVELYNDTGYRTEAIQGHKYFVSFSAKSSQAITRVAVGGVVVVQRPNLSIPANQWYNLVGIGIPATGGTQTLFDIVVSSSVSSGDTVSFKEAYYIDLTQMLGTTIADYLYTIETATAGTGVAWLKTHFPKQFDAGYQAYDAGTLKSVEGLSAHEMVGFNQWDEEWEVGGINHSTGENNSATGVIRSKNYIPCFPSTTYYFANLSNAGSPYIHYYDANKEFVSYAEVSRNTTFVTPSNARYIRFNMDTGYGTTYNHDICINLSDPTKNGTYEPYEAHSYPLDSDVVLRGIPKLDSNNQLYYDGDTYEADGTVNRRFNTVDLGTLSWVYKPNELSYPYFTAELTTRKVGAGDIMLAGYTVVASRQELLADKTVAPSNITNSYYITIRDDAYTDVQAFTIAMNGKILLYLAKNPTTETADPYQTPQIISPDGTEKYVYEGSSFELPVGHSSEYPANVSGQLDDILDTPSANGTYVLKATVTDGAVSYSWVADS